MLHTNENKNPGRTAIRGSKRVQPYWPPALAILGLPFRCLIRCAKMCLKHHPEQDVQLLELGTAPTNAPSIPTHETLVTSIHLPKPESLH